MGITKEWLAQHPEKALEIKEKLKKGREERQKRLLESKPPESQSPEPKEQKRRGRPKKQPATEQPLEPEIITEPQLLTAKTEAEVPNPVTLAEQSLDKITESAINLQLSKLISEPKTREEKEDTINNYLNSNKIELRQISEEYLEMNSNITALASLLVKAVRMLNLWQIRAKPEHQPAITDALKFAEQLDLTRVNNFNYAAKHAKKNGSSFEYEPLVRDFHQTYPAELREKAALFITSIFSGTILTREIIDYGQTVEEEARILEQTGE